MKTSVDFDSDLFRPFLPDDAQVQPGLYGAELSYWLSRQLAQRGVITTYPDYEDWCWFIEYFAEDGSEFRLICVNTDGPDKWRCRLNGDGTHEEGAHFLMRVLAELLAEEPGVRNVIWSEPEAVSKKASRNRLKLATVLVGAALALSLSLAIAGACRASTAPQPPVETLAEGESKVHVGLYSISTAIPDKRP